MFRRTVNIIAGNAYPKDWTGAPGEEPDTDINIDTETETDTDTNTKTAQGGKEKYLWGWWYNNGHSSRGLKCTTSKCESRERQCNAYS